MNGRVEVCGHNLLGIVMEVLEKTIRGPSVRITGPSPRSLPPRTLINSKTASIYTQVGLMPSVSPQPSSSYLHVPFTVGTLDLIW